MRLRLVAPAVLSLFIAIACGGKDDQSQVGGFGAAATGNNGAAGSLVIGTGGSANGTGDGTGGGDAFDPNSACATSAAEGQPIPVDLYFMVDITGSMNCPVPEKGACENDPGPPKSGDSRWSVVSAALKTFFADPANQALGAGIKFFPLQDTGGGNNNGNNGPICRASSYTAPEVEVGPLSTNSTLIVSAIGKQTPGGTTPTVPSLQAALDHATTWAKAHPTHRVVVVYATDGYPKGCGNGNTIDAAAVLAQRAFAAMPSISTYVLGVGPNLDDLNQIADAGSNKKTKAFLVDTTQNAATQLSAALASIRGSAAVDCTYTIPPPPSGQALEAGKVNVNYTNSKGEVTKVLHDAPNVPCDSGTGWQYSADGTQILLCGSACTAVKGDTGGKIQVLFGCATEVGNPPK